MAKKTVSKFDFLQSAMTAVKDPADCDDHGSVVVHRLGSLLVLSQYRDGILSTRLPDPEGSVDALIGELREVGIHVHEALPPLIAEMDSERHPLMEIDVAPYLLLFDEVQDREESFRFYLSYLDEHSLDQVAYAVRQVFDQDRYVNLYERAFAEWLSKIEDSGHPAYEEAAKRIRHSYEAANQPNLEWEAMMRVR